MIQMLMLLMYTLLIDTNDSSARGLGYAIAKHAETLGNALELYDRVENILAEYNDRKTPVKYSMKVRIENHSKTPLKFICQHVDAYGLCVTVAIGGEKAFKFTKTVHETVQTKGDPERIAPGQSVEYHMIRKDNKPIELALNFAIGDLVPGAYGAGISEYLTIACQAGVKVQPKSGVLITPPPKDSQNGFDRIIGELLITQSRESRGKKHIVRGGFDRSLQPDLDYLFQFADL